MSVDAWGVTAMVAEGLTTSRDIAGDIEDAYRPEIYEAIRQARLRGWIRKATLEGEGGCWIYEVTPTGRAVLSRPQRTSGQGYKSHRMDALGAAMAVADGVVTVREMALDFGVAHCTAARYAEAAVRRGLLEVDGWAPGKGRPRRYALTEEGRRRIAQVVRRAVA